MNKKFDLSKYKNVAIKSFELRELTGDSEMDAIARATDPSGKAGINGMQLRSQLVADAIVAVNGESVIQPYLDWQKWPLRTREFVANAFNAMNEVTKDEMSTFLEAAFGKPPEHGE
jgi:hypothetical protein